MPLLHVAPDRIEEYWPFVAGGIAEALETSNGEGSLEATKEGLLAGRTHLLMLHKGDSYFGMVVGVYNFPNFSVARILLGFGHGICMEKAEWALMEEWARKQGCKCMEAWVATNSRARLFRRFGFKPLYQIIRSDL